MITPAISVLSAVEGLEVAHAGSTTYVVPIALVVLPVLFAIQRFGTGAVGRPLRAGDAASGSPSIAILGLRQVLMHPAILRALSPTLRRRVLRRRRRDRRSWRSASVVLAVTGAEALYADMGHFGRTPDPPRLVLPRVPRADRSTTSGRARWS